MAAIADLVVRVDGPDLTDDERGELARLLRRELLGLNVADVRLVGGAIPPAGAKAGDGLAVGALAVSLAPETVGPVMNLLTSWLRRQRSEIAVEIDGQRLQGRVSREQRDAIVAAWLDRVTTREKG